MMNNHGAPLPPSNSVQNTGHTPSGVAGPGHQPPLLAPGFQAIVGACQKLYPEQKNPLQLSTVIKFWLGGPDPLDYITVYSNQTDCSHWHYVTCGLSDLHGDGRVHPPAISPQAPSGYGFELTFRLKREDELMPPNWPVKVLQKISKYVFETENRLMAGDHINWEEPLGGASGSGRLRHLIVTDDSQLGPTSCRLGSFRFLQVFCVTEDELKAVQSWNGGGVINLLRNSAVAGGLLVTDIHRKLSLFEASPHTQELVQAGIAKEGSNLCGVAACISWTETDMANSENEQKKDGGLTDWGSLTQECDRLMDSGLNSRKVTYPRGVAISCNLETAGYLPLCIHGRLKHGFHFTLKSILKEAAVTLTTESVGGTLVSPLHPFAAQGDWLQVLIQQNSLDKFQEEISRLGSVSLPHTFTFAPLNLSITVCADASQV